jgi:hypothetical protein
LSSSRPWKVSLQVGRGGAGKTRGPKKKTSSAPTFPEGPSCLSRAKEQKWTICNLPTKICGKTPFDGIRSKQMSFCIGRAPDYRNQLSCDYLLITWLQGCVSLAGTRIFILCTD